MKKWVGYLAVSIVSFVAGGLAGWLTRKKTAEVSFEEISVEEQNKQMEQDGITRPLDIQEAIDHVFAVPGKHGSYNGEPEQPAVEEEPKYIQLDTQKVQFFKKWKAEEAAEKYDTRTKEDPEHVVTTDDEDDLEAGFDHEFLSKVAEERPAMAVSAAIAPGTMDDWDHWLGIPDGEYDCVEIWWYDQDNVITDDQDEPIENPGKFIGFDIEEKFRTIGEETTGDPDIRVVYDHNSGTIFQIVRKHASYDQKKSGEEFGGDDGDDTEGWIRSRNS